MSARAGLPPTTLKGDAQSTRTTTFNFEVPNAQSTKTSTGTRLEVGNTNILVNPSWEHQTATTGWTLPAGSFTADNTPIEGLRNALITMTAQSFEYYQDSTNYATQFADGVQGLAMVRVKTSITSTPLYVCPRNAGVTAAIAQCAPISADGKWRLYKVPFILGGTSNGISITSNAVSITGDIRIDDAYVGATTIAADVGAIISDWQDYSMTIGAVTTPPTKGATSVDRAQWRRVGGNMEIRYDLKQTGAGAAGSGIYIFPIPAGFTIDNARVPSGASESAVVGTAKITSASDANGAATAPGVVLVSKTFPNRLYLNYIVGAPVETTGSVGSANYPLSGANNGYSFTASVPIVGWAGTSTVYSASCGARCEDTFTASVSSAGVVSGENIEWITGNAAGTAPYVLTFSTSLFTVAPNCTVTPDIQGTDIRIGSKTTTASTLSVTFLNVSAVASTVGFTVNCQKQGADFVATRIIVGSFNEVVTTPGVTKPEVFSVSYGTTNLTTVCSGTPCFIDTSGSTVTSITRSGTGTYALNLSKTYSKLRCTGSAGNPTTLLATTGSNAALQCTNCSTLSFITGSANTAFDAWGTLMCHGFAP